MDRARQLEVAGGGGTIGAGKRAALLQHAGELLRVQRIALGLVDELGQQVRRKLQVTQELAYQALRLFFAEGLERDRVGVLQSSSPARSALVELRARGAD